MPIELPFAVQAAESSIRQNSQERLVNMYAEVEVSETGRKKLIRRQRAGLRRLLANSSEKRAMEHNDADGLDYCVVGDTFYSFDGASLTSLGTIPSSSGRCWIIFDDFGRALISDGFRGYYWDKSTITTITTPDNVPVGPLAYQGGFGIFTVPGTAQFYITGANDFSSVNALGFATAESSPDPLLRPFIDHNQLFLCGTRSIEVWPLTGGSDFPFSPMANSQIPRGIAAPNAIVSEDNTFIILGEDRIVYRIEGYRPVRISNGAIERAILAVSQAAIDGCEAFSYTSGGQKVITFRFPGELTVQYNLATQFWNYAQTYGALDWQMLGASGGYSRYFATPSGFVALDESLNTDEGGIMRRVAVSGPGGADGRKMTFTMFRLLAEVGRAPVGIDPQVMLRFAPDGETFGNIKPRSLGETGEYNRRAVWRDLGDGEAPVIEVSMSDDCRFAIMAVLAEVEVETD